MKKIFLFIALCALFSLNLFAQTSTSLSRRCAGQTPTVKNSVVEVEKDGDISIKPCFGRSIFLNGNTLAPIITNINGQTGASQSFATGAADSAAWVSDAGTHTLNLPITAVSGENRTDFVAYFNNENTLTKAPIAIDTRSIRLFNELDAFSFRITKSGGATGLQVRNAAGTENLLMTAGGLALTTSNFVVNGATSFADSVTIGNRLLFAQNSGAECAGQVTLESGAADVNTSCASAESDILISYDGTLSNPGILTVKTKTPGQFKILSTNAADASTVKFLVIN